MKEIYYPREITIRLTNEADEKLLRSAIENAIQVCEARHLQLSNETGALRAQITELVTELEAQISAKGQEQLSLNQQVFSLNRLLPKIN